MKCLLPLMLVLGGCAFFEAAIKPASVATAAAGGAVLGGPAGAAVGAGAADAAWGISDAEEGQEVAESRLDALTIAAITGETAPLRAQLEAEASKLGDLIFWLLIALGVYLLKQPIWAWLTKRRIQIEAKLKESKAPE